MCRLGCRMELLQSRALAKVPTALREKLRSQEGKKKAQVGRRTKPDEKKGLHPCEKHNDVHLLEWDSEPCPHLPQPIFPSTHPSPGHHEKLVNLPVCERVVWVPDLHLHLLLVPVIRFSWGMGKGTIRDRKGG